MNSMKKRIFYSITGVTLITTILFPFFITVMLYQQFYRKTQTDVKIETNQIKQVMCTNQKSFNMETFQMDSIVTSNRITIIKEDGTVLFDNFEDYRYMDDHSKRPEILELYVDGEGESTRFSDTLGKQTYYYAIPLDDTTILRVAVTMDSIYSMIMKTIPYLIIIIIFVILLSMYLSKQLTRKIISPLYHIKEQTYDELDLFYKKINKQKRLLRSQKKQLQRRKEEFKIITENIADGLILLNDNYEIVSINQKAINILGKRGNDYRSKNIMELNRLGELRDAIVKAYAGENCEIVQDIEKKQYILHIAPIYKEEIVKGVVILVVDNTGKAESERMRREFSANVSHELKTPLTSISGYAELLKEGIVKSEDIPVFANKIYSEAQRLITLIEGIIKISKIDEFTLKQNKETIDLKKLLEETIDRLDLLAMEKNIDYNLALEKVEYNGIKSILEEVFYNILENSIKYNVENGNIEVRLEQKELELIVTIKDTGIGIPEESIERIFERFYRVDTSHSNYIQGTGLGLSIVKHAMNLHKGTIHVTSDISKGTKITLCFPLDV